MWSLFTFYFLCESSKADKLPGSLGGAGEGGGVSLRPKLNGVKELNPGKTTCFCLGEMAHLKDKVLCLQDPYGDLI